MTTVTVSISKSCDIKIVYAPLATMGTEARKLGKATKVCTVPRAVPMAEAAAAIAIYDLIPGNTQTTRRKS